MKKGDIIQTPHGAGPIEHFEIYPPLYARNGTTQPYVGPDYLPELPAADELMEGSFIRVGVRGVHPTITVAHYTLSDLGLDSFH